MGPGPRGEDHARLGAVDHLDSSLSADNQGVAEFQEEASLEDSDDLTELGIECDRVLNRAELTVDDPVPTIRHEGSADGGGPEAGYGTKMLNPAFGVFQA